MPFRMLLVEASPTQAVALRFVLEDNADEILTASSGTQAIEQFQLYSPEVVLINYTLPDSTGSELCQELRRQHPTVCLIVIADAGSAEQILESLSAGADAFCFKSADLSLLPEQVERAFHLSQQRGQALTHTLTYQGHDYQLSLTPEQWLDVLLTTLTNLGTLREQIRELHQQIQQLESASISDSSIESACQETVTKETSATDLPLSVLLAEDSNTNQTLGRLLLEGAGYHVITAENGSEVLAEFDGPYAANLVCILMDVEMPVMDGLEATRRWREQEQSTAHHLPILAMTALTEESERQRCLDAGMDACLSKPIQIEDVEQTLKQIESQLKQPRQRPSETETEDDQGTSESPLVDWDWAMTVVGGDKQLLAEIIQAVMEEWPQRKSDAELALQTDDRELLGRTAHTFSGLLRSFQPNPQPGSAADLAHQLETLAPTAPLAEWSSLFVLFCEKMQPVLEQLQQLPWSSESEGE